MKTYTLTMNIQAGDDVDADKIRDEIYEAAGNVPFSFGIASITELMPAAFLAEHCTISWHGTDSDTPTGHTTAIGTGPSGTQYLWLFKGDQPTDDAFVGSVTIPVQPRQIPDAYGRGGDLIGPAPDMKSALADLAARAAAEEK
ncbi:hypothetical protein ACIG3E_33375 [Streptomyces sp. NPDC053474]|uniref:hypothetical protein n=1 Tax=Streptomyces sp. NPDC053474 TaxID=3365704 RepID=UPI0037D47739